MFQRISAVFPDVDMEWDFRKTYGRTVANKLQHLLAFLFVFNSIVLIYDWQLTHDAVLFTMRLASCILLVILLDQISEKGIHEFYYNRIKYVLVLSVVLPLYRYHVYQHVNSDLFSMELGLFVIAIWTVIRAIFLMLPTSWVIVTTCIHILGFSILTVLEQGYMFFWLYSQHILLLFLFSCVMFFVVWQFNKLLRNAYYLKEVVYKKLDSLRRVENAFASETTSQVLAHEIKTPLATASGYAQILNGYNDLPEPVHKMSEKILQSCNTIDEIIKTIRGLSFDALTLRKESILDVINDAEGLWQTALQDKSGHFVLEGNDYFVKVDKILLQSAISNLIRNAIEAKENSHVSVRLYDNQDMVRIDIENDKEIKRDLDDIFTVFKSSSKKNSTGVGLAFSKDVIEKMNGSIVCKTEKDKTCFTISLPMV